MSQATLRVIARLVTRAGMSKRGLTPFFWGVRVGIMTISNQELQVRFPKNMRLIT